MMLLSSGSCSFRLALGVLLVALCGQAVGYLGERRPLVNYGVMLEELGQLDINEQQWVHTYRLPLPNRNPPLGTEGCPFRNSQVCENYPSLEEHFRAVQRALRAEWSKFLTKYRSMVPSVPTSPPPTPTGVDTVQQAIYDNLQALMKTGKAENLDFRTNSLRKSSTQELQNSEVSALMADLQGASQTLERLAEEAGSHLGKSAQAQLDAASFVSAATLHLWDTRTLVEQLSAAILAASGGKMSRDLVTPVALASTLDEVDRALVDEYHPFVLMPPANRPEFYYANGKVYAHRDADFLYVSVTLPVTHGTPYTVYSVQSFPLALGPSLATQLLDLPPVFALDRNATSYFAMTQAQFDQCSRSSSGELTCRHSLTSLRSAALPDCLLGVATDNQTMVRQQCRPALLPKGLKPSLWRFQAGKVLVSSANEALVKCLDSTFRLPAVPQLVVDVPCQCSLVAQGMAVPDSLFDCSQMLQPAFTYPINLGALLLLHDPKSLAAYTGSDLLTSAPEMSFPEIEIESASSLEFDAFCKPQPLDLKLVLTRVQAGKSIFASALDALLSRQGAEGEKGEEDMHSGAVVLFALGCVLLVIACSSVFVMARNMRRLDMRLVQLESHGCLQPPKMVEVQMTDLCDPEPRASAAQEADFYVSDETEPEENTSEKTCLRDQK